uniref:Natriuretic peptide B n=1 Tax=Xenopus tropicalis TaxID=8364 RepID=A0A803JPM9_XENTR
MEWKVFLFCGSLLFVSLQFQSCAAHPVMDLDKDRDLDTLKGVLERLEEKLAVMEALDADATNPSSEDADAARLAVIDQEEIASQSFPEPQLPLKDSFLKGLRSLRNPKMMRGSGCFGRRIDRIDSLSGMGCNVLKERKQSED